MANYWNYKDYTYIVDFIDNNTKVAITVQDGEYKAVKGKGKRTFSIEAYNKCKHKNDVHELYNSKK